LNSLNNHRSAGVYGFSVKKVLSIVFILHP